MYESRYENSYINFHGMKRVLDLVIGITSDGSKNFYQLFTMFDAQNLIETDMKIFGSG